MSMVERTRHLYMSVPNAKLSSPFLDMNLETCDTKVT